LLLAADDDDDEGADADDDEDDDDDGVDDDDDTLGNVDDDDDSRTKAVCSSEIDSIVYSFVFVTPCLIWLAISNFAVLFPSPTPI
jgi:hypothetical protein